MNRDCETWGHTQKPKQAPLQPKTGDYHQEATACHACKNIHWITYKALVGMDYDMDWIMVDIR